MTVDDFNSLKEAEQIRIVLRNDTLIAQRGEGPRSMDLYVVEDFYVEVIFTTRKKNVLKIYASKEDHMIEPYLKQIDLSELLE